MDTKTYAVVDLETTGHSPENGDRIIQIAIVFIKNGEIDEKYVRFVNPGTKNSCYSFVNLRIFQMKTSKMHRTLRKLRLK